VTALVDQLYGPQQAGTSVVDGATWTRWTSVDGARRALTRQQDGAAVIVHGTAGWTELEEFAAALTAR